jgi:hypothetical protein
MPDWTLLVILFWGIIPGLITGWMLRERGRSFVHGFLFGALCGPLGILLALAYISLTDRGKARSHASRHGRAVRVFYDIPIVGPLHVSTVWALAGLATFLCLWMVGGIGYEFYRAGRSPVAPERASQTAAGTLPAQGLPSPGNSPPGNNSSEPKALTASAQVNSSSQPHADLLGNIPGQAGQMSGRSENASAQLSQPTPTDPNGTASGTPRPEANVAAPAPTTAPQAAAPPPPAKAPAQTRETAVSEVTRELASRGYGVHAALSGDAQTSTLSLSGASLTRGVGNQLLGNRHLRDALKGAGVRIVVMINGQESWTYIL